jgi:hypothetical protein
METTFDYLRQFGPLLAERILETYPPLQSTKDPVAPGLAGLLRKPLPAQAVAITGTAKYLRKAKAARIVAECGAGKTFMALGTIHVLSEGLPNTALVMCPSHITHKWAREVLLTTPRARTFLIEDMRNGGDPAKPHGVREGVGEVAIAVDCSGSVSARQLRLFEAEVRSILEGQRPERVYVLYFDAVVQKVETYEAGQRIDLNPVGGGGTEFGPCFEWLDRSGIRPRSLVFLTDLYGSFPPSAPSYPVLWASTGSRKAPFGEVIPMHAA